MDTDPAPFPPPSPIDPAMQARLARLAANRPTSSPAPNGGGLSARSGRKRHAAKRARAAALLMSVTTAGGLAAYFQQADSAAASGGTFSLSGAAASSSAASASAGASTGSVTTPAATPATGTTSPAAAPTTSTLADGTYTGATATNKWGPVQVEITVSGGKVTEAVALQTPTADRKSISINQRATPTLASEALSAQSAQIDTVSGATYTSTSYKASLQSAIDLARSSASSSGAAS